MSIYKYCEYCRSQYIAQRNSAKYCSDSHKTMACRNRRKAELKAANDLAALKIQEQQLEDFFVKAKADFENYKTEYFAKKNNSI